MKIWMDIINSSQVCVLMPIYRHLVQKGHVVIVTARDFSETIPLLKQNGINPIVYGKHEGKNKWKKAIGMLIRIITLIFRVPSFDITISAAGTYSGVVAFLRRKKSVSILDNDIAKHQFSAFVFGDIFIFPKYFNYETIVEKYRLKPEQIKLYNGFKEDIYIGEYNPDKHFLEQLPFVDFITIRPENLKAAYVPKDVVSIVPKLFEIFKDRNILFLPRYEEEKTYADGYKNVWYPSHPLNGLDVCYYTQAMLTGAGTFAREAALLGVPAVSFFPGKTFLGVDVVMQEKGLEFKSRDINEIKKYVDNAKRKESMVENSKNVLKEVLHIIDNILDETNI